MGVMIIKMVTKEEARYLQDKATLDQYPNLKNKYTAFDIKILNILPENFIRWKNADDKKEINDDIVENKIWIN